MFAPINLTATGVVVAAVPGMAVRLLSQKLVASAALTVQWTDNGSSPVTLEGACTMAVGVPQTLPPAMTAFSRTAYFETSVGGGLTLTIVGAGQVSGFIEYELVRH